MASGSDTETTTQSTAPSNPDVNPTISKLLQGVQSTYDSTKAGGTSTALTGGWGMQGEAAMNPDYAAGINGALKSYSDVAAGNQMGTNAPGYAAMREGALNDAMTGVGSSFLTDGRFGSSVMGDAAGKAATQTLAGLDYANYQNDLKRQDTATQMLPSLFAAGQAPGSVISSIGQQQEELPWANLGRASSIASGNYGAGGTTSSTTSPSAPWWQQALGAGAVGSGIYKNVWGS